MREARASRSQLVTLFFNICNQGNSFCFDLPEPNHMGGTGMDASSPAHSGPCVRESAAPGVQSLVDFMNPLTGSEARDVAG